MKRFLCKSSLPFSPLFFIFVEISIPQKCVYTHIHMYLMEFGLKQIRLKVLGPTIAVEAIAIPTVGVHICSTLGIWGSTFPGVINIYIYAT